MSHAAAALHRAAATPIADAIGGWRRDHSSGRPLVVGLCAPQGAGKSTIAAGLAAALPATRLAVLSLDDLYLSPAARAGLARGVHPLLATRGVPGTHDVVLGVDVLARLVAGERVRLPRFDKATDAPRPRAEWPATGAVDVVLFEGWCVGAVAQPEAMLAAPVNELEAREDADGRWRRFVNAQLADPYTALFAFIDRLILLRAPDFATVVGWRQEAERRAGGAMDDAATRRFCRHYERLTDWTAAEMPDRADLTLDLAADRSVASARVPE